MKLNRFEFARVITMVSRICGRNLANDEMMDLDAAIDVEVPEIATKTFANPREVENLMSFMVNGTQKIEAIKSFRMLTGLGLKDSKDAVERYWFTKTYEKPYEPGNLGDILGQATKK